MSSSLDPLERFDDLAAHRLRARGAAAPDEIDALDLFARGMPGRKSRGWTHAPLLAAVLSVLAVGLAALALLLGPGSSPAAVESTQPSSTTFTPMASPTSPAASEPSSSLPQPSLPDPSVWSTDPRVRWCGGLNPTGARVLTVYEFAAANEYRVRIPALGYVTALEKPDAVLVIVYEGASPTDLDLGLASPRTHIPAAGTHDICIGAVDWHQRLLDVRIDWAYLAGLATHNRTAGPPTILAKLPDKYGSYGTNLVWDEPRGLQTWPRVGQPATMTRQS